MYTTKEAEEINKPAQINNAKAILNACDGKDEYGNTVGVL